MDSNTVPFFRPSITEAEIAEVVDTLRSGWLTTGPKARRFETEFAHAVGARHAVALSSCTAALHLAVEAMGLGPGDVALVPTMTFAATAEVVRYQGATPVLVDCDPMTLNMCLDDAEAKLDLVRRGTLPPAARSSAPPVGILPVHVGGLMLDVAAVNDLARRHELWVVEDAAHAFPAAWRPDRWAPWQRCGEDTATVSCFSFYANKTITTGEGGMAVTGDERIADRMRTMSLHGLSHDAWNRYSTPGSWDYRITAAGYKYNMTDMAAALGLQQLRRAESLRREREAIAHRYRERLADVEEIELPPDDANRVHAWHLFPLRLRLERLAIDRDRFVAKLAAGGVHCSVHWRPLHLHPYYETALGWQPAHCPVATEVWRRLVSLPLFPGMTEGQIEHVVRLVRETCARPERARTSVAGQSR